MSVAGGARLPCVAWKHYSLLSCFTQFVHSSLTNLSPSQAITNDYVFGQVCNDSNDFSMTDVSVTE